MKLKTIIIIACMLILISSVNGLTNCPSNAEFEDAIRSAIVNYFRTHSEEDLNVLKDLIEFYSTHDLSTADCSEVGKNSGVEIQEVYNDAGNVSEVVEGVDEKSVSLANEVFSWVDDLLHSEWISNNIIGITLHSWSSDDFQFPIDSNNLWDSGGMRFAVRYNNDLKWSHDGWIGSSIQTLPVTEELHFTENTNDKKIAVGKVADSNIEVKTEATLLKDKKWMLIKYTLTNKGSSAVSNVKFYQGADFDVDHVTYSNDYGGYDSNLKLLYEWDSDGNPYVGFASSLSPAKHDVTQYESMWDKIISDSLGDSNNYGMGDVGVAFRWDFGTLYPGETKEIPIILGAGASLSDLKTEINNGLGYISPVPEPKLKILFVPLRWQGNQDSFVNAVNIQKNFWLNEIPLRNCPEKLQFKLLDVNTQNFNDFRCSLNDCGADLIKPYVRDTLGIHEYYDTIFGLSNIPRPCGENNPTVGCNGGDVSWGTTRDFNTFAHEMGHYFGLSDERCSNPAGSIHPLCNDGHQWNWIQPDWSSRPIYLWPSDINYLDADLGCNPNQGGGCCETKDYDFNGSIDLCDGYFYGICCEGNSIARGGEVGKSTMSYATINPDPDHPVIKRGYDVNSLAHLATQEQLSCG